MDLIGGVRAGDASYGGPRAKGQIRIVEVHGAQMQGPHSRREVQCVTVLWAGHRTAAQNVCRTERAPHKCYKA